MQRDEFYLRIQKEGQDLLLLNDQETRQHPFPGLRSFKTSESHLFFGREGQSHELLKRLDRNRFVAVLGASGSGKSSLVRAGLIPTLHAGYLLSAGSRWKIAICRPGNSPIPNLAASLESTGVQPSPDQTAEERVARISESLYESSFGLVEVAAAGYGKGEHNLIVIVDQFEELFRYSAGYDADAALEEATLFVNLLVEAARQTQVPIYVLITIRTEFMGECVRFRGLTDLINEGQYFVPRLNSSQIRSAIEGPLAVVDARITPTLANRLLNDMGDNMDQLPILQHALARTYQLWYQGGEHGTIDHHHYDVTGKMDKALDNHANELLYSLNEREQTIARLLFQALTEKNPDNQGIRRPTSVRQICGICQVVGATSAEVREVIDLFRQSETSFLVPAPPTPLHDDTIVDISHESLMRLWDKLADWVEEEAEDAKNYAILHTKRKFFDEGKEGILMDRQLAILLDWYGRKRPNFHWASRYHRNNQADEALNSRIFEDNIQYLKHSETVHEELEAHKEAQKMALLNYQHELRQQDLMHRQQEQVHRQQQKQLSIIFFGALATVVAISFTALQFYQQKKKAERNEAIIKTEKHRADSLLSVSIQTLNEAGLYKNTINYAKSVAGEAAKKGGGAKQDSLLGEINRILSRGEKLAGLAAANASNALPRPVARRPSRRPVATPTADAGTEVKAKQEALLLEVDHLIKQAAANARAEQPVEGYYQLRRAYFKLADVPFREDLQGQAEQFRRVISDKLQEVYNNRSMLEKLVAYDRQVARVWKAPKLNGSILLLEDNTLLVDEASKREKRELGRLAADEKVNEVTFAPGSSDYTLHVTRNADHYAYTGNLRTGGLTKHHVLGIDAAGPLAAYYTSDYKVVLFNASPGMGVKGRIYKVKDGAGKDSDIACNCAIEPFGPTALSPENGLLLVNVVTEKQKSLAGIRLRDGGLTKLDAPGPLQSVLWAGNNFLGTTANGRTYQLSPDGAGPVPYQRSMRPVNHLSASGKEYIFSNRSPYFTVFSTSPNGLREVSNLRLEQLPKLAHNALRLDPSADYLVMHNDRTVYCLDLAAKKLQEITLSEPVLEAYFTSDGRGIVIVTNVAKKLWYFQPRPLLDLPEAIIDQVDVEMVFGESWPLVGRNSDL
jgi:energy-coupling factor transporter ATP-binding protein EcfA2